MTQLKDSRKVSNDKELQKWVEDMLIRKAMTFKRLSKDKATSWARECLKKQRQ